MVRKTQTDLGENSHKERQAEGMGKLSDMEAEFDCISSVIRKGVGILVTNKAYSQLELFCRCCSLLKERQDVAILMHNIQSGILKVEDFLQDSEHYILQILCKNNQHSRYTDVYL
jgi:hypothetical protein